MPDDKKVPDNTAVRVALWRALHGLIDAPPHIIQDEVGLKLAAPDAAWRDRPDMNPEWTSPFRASIVARARFIEDLVIEQAGHGVDQYVILGAGLDSFVQRHPEMANRLTVFEVDQPVSQAWKRQRLVDLGFGVPQWLRLVPVDFEGGDDWLTRLAAAGFDAAKPAVIVSTGVSMYLTRDAVLTTLRHVASLAHGSTFAMTFLLPLELMDAEVRPGFQMAEKGARAAGTPFISFLSRRRSWRWPPRRGSGTRAMYRAPISPGAILPADLITFVHPTMPRTCCWRIADQTCARTGMEINRRQGFFGPCQITMR